MIVGYAITLCAQSYEIHDVHVSFDKDLLVYLPK